MLAGLLGLDAQNLGIRDAGRALADRFGQDGGVAVTGMIDDGDGIHGKTPFVCSLDKSFTSIEEVGT